MSEARKHKSRAGCQQCKRRRVKCDESVPACKQCCRQKLQCPGYLKPLKWKTTPEARKSPGLHRTNHVQAIILREPPGLLTPSLSPDIEGSSLIWHYFSRICKLAGCFDSDLNPFRSLATTMMSYSKPIYLLLQASSAAHLSVQYPALRLKALSLQADAFSAVRADISALRGDANIVSDELMISSIIAGLTSAWYDVNDVGHSHVLGGQVLLYLWLTPQRKRLKYQQTFILGCFVYWLTISSFVVGDAQASLEYQSNLLNTINSLEMSHDIVNDAALPENQRRIIPHPLAGFSIALLVSVGKVGAICRIKQTPSSDNLLERAELIEAELLANPQKLQNNFTDPQDPQTTVGEILAVGEAYRCAGLLQLYTTFPQLLQRQAGGSDLEVEMEAMILNERGELTASQHNFLINLAAHICGILQAIPTESGTRVLQGLPVIIASTWLVDPIPTQSERLSHPLLTLGGRERCKNGWREAVMRGLESHGERVGLRQVERIMQIVKEIWMVDDGKTGEGKCDWMAVIAGKGMQTLYG